MDDDEEEHGMDVSGGGSGGRGWGPDAGRHKTVDCDPKWMFKGKLRMWGLFIITKD